ncbi:MAG: acylphosphatase [Candidatus Contendobacter odensis]|uniref:acylphosphatase n=1 Tax=Candidatus Contendibacter odensensis TaxID=1400860 RepID=A0A2G6PFZ7_9GAMM|nr:MAG: acylphosphatase [Candidatus Contendobacter odensis]
MENKLLCLRCYISGRVQGVGFRYATANKAAALGITGYARNLPDRRVEVLACGNENAVLALRHWLQQGPAPAQVSDIHCKTVPYHQYSDFQIE